MKILKFKTAEQIRTLRMCANACMYIIPLSFVIFTTAAMFNGWGLVLEIVILSNIAISLEYYFFQLYQASSPMSTDHINQMINDLVELNDAELSHQVESALSSSMVITQANFDEIYRRIDLIKDRRSKQEFAEKLQNKNKLRSSVFN